MLRDYEEMKKIVLVIIASLLIFANSHCQWYQRQYGVNDPNHLSQDQLNEALRKAKSGVTTGVILSTAGVLGIIGGIILMKSDSPIPGDIGKNMLGLELTAVSVPIEITGLILWGRFSDRTKTLKGILKKTEIDIGLINSPLVGASTGLINNPSPGLSVTFRF
jgi:hypothetical protein